MSDTPKVILADKFATLVCEALGVDARTCHRVIIDATAGSVLRVYFDCYGDERLLELVPPLASEPNIRRYMLNEKGDHVEITTADSEDRSVTGRTL